MRKVRLRLQAPEESCFGNTVAGIQTLLWPQEGNPKEQQLYGYIQYVSWPAVLAGYRLIDSRYSSSALWTYLGEVVE